jgi:predicted DNA-binding transcriptional regulator AlpA
MSPISTDRPSRLLNSRQVCARVGLSRSTVRRLERAGRFPSHIKISPARVAWREPEIDAFVDGRWPPKAGAT